MKLLSDKRNTLEADQGISDIYRSFLFWNLEMDAWSIISNYKTLLTYAPMFAGVKDAPKPKAEDLKVDSTYYDDLLKFSIVRNPSAMYCFDYPSFLLSQEILGKNKISADELSSQVVGANRLFSQLDKEYKILTVDQENEVNRYSLKEFANILNDKNKGLIDLLATNAKKTGYKVCEMDTAVSGDKLLQALVSPYKGKVVLVDVWATWCGPWVKNADKELPRLIVRDRQTKVAPLGDWSVRLAADVFAYKQGMGSNRYFNWEKLYNNSQTGYMQRLAPVEKEVFHKSIPVLDRWRKKGAIDGKEMQQLYNELDQYIEMRYKPIIDP